MNLNQIVISICLLYLISGPFVYAVTCTSGGVTYQVGETVYLDGIEYQCVDVDGVGDWRAVAGDSSSGEYCLIDGFRYASGTVQVMGDVRYICDLSGDWTPLEYFCSNLRRNYGTGETTLIHDLEYECTWNGKWVAMSDLSVEVSPVTDLGLTGTGQRKDLNVTVYSTDCPDCEIWFGLQGPRTGYAGFVSKEIDWFFHSSFGDGDVISHTVTTPSEPGEYRIIYQVYGPGGPDLDLKRSRLAYDIFEVSEGVVDEEPVQKPSGEPGDPGVVGHGGSAELAVNTKEIGSCDPADGAVRFFVYYLEPETSEWGLAHFRDIRSPPDADGWYRYSFRVFNDWPRGEYKYSAGCVKFIDPANPGGSSYLASVSSEREFLIDYPAEVTLVQDLGTVGMGATAELKAYLERIDGGTCPGCMVEFKINWNYNSGTGEWDNYDHIYVPFDPEQGSGWVSTLLHTADYVLGDYVYSAILVRPRGIEGWVNYRSEFSEEGRFKIASQGDDSGHPNPENWGAGAVLTVEVNNDDPSCSGNLPVTWEIKRFGEEDFHEYNCPGAEEMNVPVGGSGVIICDSEGIPSYESGPHSVKFHWCTYDVEFDYGHPKEFDWSHQVLKEAPPSDPGDWMSPVKRQGICDSCGAHTVMSVIEAKYNIQAGDCNLDIDISEEDIISCCQTCAWSGTTVDHRAPGDCCGMAVIYTLDYVRDKGVVTEDDMGYVSGMCECVDGVCDYPETCSKSLPCGNSVCVSGREDKLRFFIRDYEVLSGHERIKTQIIKHGPVITTMDIDSWKDYSGKCAKDSSIPSHSVVIVGYSDVKGWWVVRNSWGDHWGINGYFTVDYNSNCGLEDKCYSITGNVYSSGG